MVITHTVTAEELFELVTPKPVSELTGEGDPYTAPQPAFFTQMVAAGASASTSSQPVPQPIFYLYDHLGNTRVTFSADVCVPNISTPVYKILQAADYYPYSKILREYYAPSRERYLSTQHERDAESGFDYRGARLSDGEVLRFLSVDPLAEMYYGWSPYNYVLGNPIRLIDPTGRGVETCPTCPQDGTFKDAIASADEYVYDNGDKAAYLKESNGIINVSTTVEPVITASKVEKSPSVYDKIEDGANYVMKGISGFNPREAERAAIREGRPVFANAREAFKPAVNVVVTTAAAYGTGASAVGLKTATSLEAVFLSTDITLNYAGLKEQFTGNKVSPDGKAFNQFFSGLSMVKDLFRGNVSPANIADMNDFLDVFVNEKK